jgi:hypothetical protein
MTEPDNLLVLKDDMIAFIEGHGIRHFPAMIPEEAPRIWWNDPTNSESWKDFVEMAKTVNAPLILIAEDHLDATTLEMLLEELQDLASHDGIEVDTEQANDLLQHVGKTGKIELAFAHQGFLFVHETMTAWYDQYQSLVGAIDSLQNLLEPDDDVEDEDDA